jgi:hypothetical protein|tara:strand:- start:80 stop:307 length:228 start_codon:yes stop_codon:yes gene_type:complete
MTKFSYPDSSNWREEYKQFTSNKKELELLENGPKSLAQSWHLQAMYNRWKTIKGIKDPEPPDCQSSFKDWSEKNK